MIRGMFSIEKTYFSSERFLKSFFLVKTGNGSIKHRLKNSITIALIKRLAVFNASSPVGVLTDSMILPLKLLIQALEFILLNSSKLKVILNRLNDIKLPS